jgi:RNA polymerase sigma factor (sigma-70 family)
VQDRGTGLPPEDVDRLFDAFVTTKPDGMGMGLPVSRTMIEAHGGRLWAAPNPRGGATFRFTLPLKQPRKEVLPADRSATSDSPSEIRKHIVESDPAVFVVDDDEMARDSVCALVHSMGLPARAFASAESFLAAYAGEPGCLVTDVRMLGMSGTELQEQLARADVPLPVIVITGFATTPLTVQAVQRGAVTVLEKPCSDQELWDAIRKGLAQDAESRQQRARRRELQNRIDQLTPQERQVMDRMLAGQPNKSIARALGVSVRTVESRRHNVFEKLRTESVAELVRLVMEAEGRS